MAVRISSIDKIFEFQSLTFQYLQLEKRRVHSNQTHYALVPGEASLPSLPEEISSPKDSGISKHQYARLIYHIKLGLTLRLLESHHIQ